MRKILSMIMTLAVVFSLCGNAFAAEDINLLEEMSCEASDNIDISSNN